ncbi:hypothetical protein NDA03_25760 [Trichocoleus sp. Lan]|uniref:hypothetical protein n=1 Tax=Trichocoleus sp. Lan TaxID=2933927 RepID=UPI003296A49A
MEQRNQELRVKLTEVRKKLVDVETEKKNDQYTLDAVRLKLLNLETENEALNQRLDTIASPTAEETVPTGIPEVAVQGDAEIEKSEDAIALPATTSPQVEASEPGEVTDKPPCPNCGEAVRIRNNGIRKNRDGIPISQRWRCNSCEKSWSEVIVAESTTAS